MSILWAWLWVIVMIVVASFTVRSRAPEVPGLLPLALLAFGCSAVLTLGVLFGLGVFQLDVRTLIPLAGLMIGNSLAATVLVGRRLIDELTDKRDEVEARLALGQPAHDAAKPYVRSALRTAMIPQIETTKAVGLVVLAGRHDRSHPGRGEAPQRGARPGLGDVPGAGLRSRPRRPWSRSACNAGSSPLTTGSSTSRPACWALATGDGPTLPRGGRRPSHATGGRRLRGA